MPPRRRRSPARSTRAPTRLSQAPDEQFVLASDGTIRWTGDAVGKLVAGEDVLRPRVRILADEQLTGASREQVQARLDLWIKAHIDKLLGPLIALAAAEDVTGIARGVAFQLVEALGRAGAAEGRRGCEGARSAVARDLAQIRRALRRLSHLHAAAAEARAARAGDAALCAQARVRATCEGSTRCSNSPPAAALRSRSNKEFPKSLYRAAGYRVCGERAVRVDILERLADLIRPALAWRDNSPGVKPPGALDGSGFTVTVGMTSLVGSSGEDFASILRSLGYRMERRPKPAGAGRTQLSRLPRRTRSNAAASETPHGCVRRRKRDVDAASEVDVATPLPRHPACCRMRCRNSRRRKSCRRAKRSRSQAESRRPTRERKPPRAAAEPAAEMFRESDNCRCAG